MSAVLQPADLRADPHEPLDATDHRALRFLTAGSVRGFAFCLGLSVLLDLVASYFFMRPAVAFLTRSKLGGKRSLFGIPVLYTPAELADQRGPGLPYVPEVEPSADLATTVGGKR